MVSSIPLLPATTDRGVIIRSWMMQHSGQRKSEFKMRFFKNCLSQMPPVTPSACSCVAPPGTVPVNPLY